MADTYSLRKYSSDEQMQRFPVIPLASLTSAAVFMAQLLKNANITYALMGGLAAIYLGAPRSTRDVDIAFQAPEGMRQLRRVIADESRLIIPDTLLASGIVRVFVKTGPGYDSCPRYIEVEVDLIQTGHLGSPLQLSNNTMTLTIPNGDVNGPETVQLECISIRYLLQAKMGAYAARRKETDLADMEFITEKYSQDVRLAVGQLDSKIVEEFLEALDTDEEEFWREYLGF